MATDHPGTIVSFSDKSGYGIATFRLKSKEEKAYFELENTTVGGTREPILTLLDKKIIVGMEAQLSKCVLLTEDDLRAGQHRNTVVRYKAHVDIKHTPESFANVIVTNNEMKGMTFNGVITLLTKGSGIVSFELNGKKEKASFHQAHANVDGIPVPRYMKLRTLFEPGMEVVLTNTQRLYEESDTTIGYRCYANVIGSTKNYALKSGTTVPLCRKVLSGTVRSVEEGSGVVLFHLYEQEELAFFHKPDTTVSGRHLLKETPLKAVLSVGQEVSVSYITRLQDIGNDEVRYKAQVNVEGVTNGSNGNTFDLTEAANDSKIKLKRQRQKGEETSELESDEKVSRPTLPEEETSSKIHVTSETSSVV